MADRRERDAMCLVTNVQWLIVLLFQHMANTSSKGRMLF